MKAKCVKCGRFCSGLKATTEYVEAGYASGSLLSSVTAVCSKHGCTGARPGYEWLKAFC